jgi:hypothetical protein
MTRAAFPDFQLTASPQTGLSPANPRVVHLHFSAQRFAFQVHHRSAELVEHHPRRLVTSQTELTLQKKGRDATLIGGHQVRGPEPNGQWELRVVKHCPRRQRYLAPTACTLPASQPSQFMSTSVPRNADTQNRPAIDRQPSMTGTRLRWRTGTGIRVGSSEMPVEPPRYTTACGLLKQPDKQKVFSPGIWCILFQRMEGGTMGQILHRSATTTEAVR